MENALKHRHEKEIKEMEIKLQNFHNRNVDEIREIKLEANNVVEKSILDTEKHIQEVRTYIYISVLPFHHSAHLFNVFMCFNSCLNTLLIIFSLNITSIVILSNYDTIIFIFHFNFQF